MNIRSIKRDTSNTLSANIIERPDGGMIMTNVPLLAVLNRVFAPIVLAQMVGVPDWARTERYDIAATSVLPSATSGQRKAMLEAMLADRFKFVGHREAREQATYDLVPAQSDHSLGSGMTPTDEDCNRIMAERAASPSPEPPFDARTAHILVIDHVERPTED